MCFSGQAQLARQQGTQLATRQRRRYLQALYQKRGRGAQLCVSLEDFLEKLPRTS